MTQNKLRAWRHHWQISQQAAANIFGVPQSCLALYEAGTAMATPDSVRKITYATTRLGPYAITADDLQAAWEKSNPAWDARRAAARVSSARKALTDGKEGNAENHKGKKERRGRRPREAPAVAHE